MQNSNLEKELKSNNKSKFAQLKAVIIQIEYSRKAEEQQHCRNNNK